MRARPAPIGGPATDEFQPPKAGRVLFHIPNRDELCQKAAELRLGYFAFPYVGEMPKNILSSFD